MAAGEYQSGEVFMVAAAEAEADTVRIRPPLVPGEMGVEAGADCTTI